MTWTTDDIEWQYDDASGLIVGQLDVDEAVIDLLVEDIRYPIVEVWERSRVTGWERTERIELNRTDNLAQSQEALVAWANSMI